MPLTLLEDEFNQLKIAASSKLNGTNILDSFYQLDANCQPVSYVFNSNNSQFAFDQLENLLQSIASTSGSSESASLYSSHMQQQQQQQPQQQDSNFNVNLLKSHVHVILKEVLKLKNRPGTHILSFVKVRQGKSEKKIETETTREREREEKGGKEKFVTFDSIV